jgi:anaerobic magnesium-protoporphyrin IX monomethyl ester cyclase
MKKVTANQADVVLCRPGMASLAERRWGRNLPLGLGYLSAAVRADGISVDVVDAKIEEHASSTATVAAIMSRHPKYVGISAMTVEYPLASQIAEKIKASSNPPVVILGGVHANALPEQSLSETGAFDYVLTGQAEESFVTFLHCLQDKAPVTSVSGLFWRAQNGKILHNPQEKDFPDLTTLSFPAWDLWPSRKEYPIMIERGCPYKCVFCCHNMGRIVRSRPVDHVMKEIRWLRERFGADTINFEDETFGLDREKTEDLLKKCIEYNRDWRIKFNAQTRVDRISSGFASLMKSAGFEFVCFGIESGDDEVLKRAQKDISVMQIEEAAQIIRRAGLKFWANFLLGLPGETRESALRTIRLAVRMNPEQFAAAVIVAYPGCKIYEWARNNENGYRLLSHNWKRFDKYLSTSIELETIDIRSLKRLQFRMFIEVYLRNGRLVELFLKGLKEFPVVVSIIKSLILSHIQIRSDDGSGDIRK